MSPSTALVLRSHPVLPAMTAPAPAPAAATVPDNHQQAPHRRFPWTHHKDRLHLPTLTLYLLSSVSPTITNRARQTALHLAAIRGSTLVATFLIAKRSAALDPRDAHGSTPLHCAAAHNQSAVAGLLLRAGADPDALDAAGHAPLHLARGYAVARTLLEGGADVDLRTRREGETALHRAARAGDGRMVLLLLAEGAEVGVRRADGAVPMHEAAKWCEVKTLGALVRFGARVDVPDRWGFTPAAYLQWRVVPGDPGAHVEMLELFRAAGAWR